MPWHKKASAPAYVNLAEASSVLLGGTGDEWLLQWWEFVDQRVVDVENTICAPGPETCDPFTEFDFLGFAGKPGPLTIVQGLTLVPKLNCFARNRMFSALCEFTGGDPGVCFEFNQTVTGGPENTVAGTGTLPTTGDLDWTVRTYWTSNNDRALIAFQYQAANGSWVDIYNVDNYQNGWPDGNTTTGHGGGNSNWWGRPWRWVLNTPGDGTNIGIHVTWSGACAAPPPDPQAIARPPAAIDRPAGSYPDLDAIGRELDKHEQKLDWLLAGSVEDAITGIGALVAAGGDVPVDNGLEVVLEDDIKAVAITVTTLGADADLSFGDPPRLYHLGRVVLGNQYGWLPPYDLAVSPMLIYPLPPGIDRVRVHVNGGSSATVQRLKLGEPAG